MGKKMMKLDAVSGILAESIDKSKEESSPVQGLIESPLADVYLSHKNIKK